MNPEALTQLQQALSALMPAQPAPQPVDEAMLIDLIKKHAQITNTVEVIKPDIPDAKKIKNAHPLLAKILRRVNARNPDGTRMNVYLYGPAGSGKTTIGFQVADALDLDLYCQGAFLTPYELIGNKDAHGNYAETPFYKAFKYGGVFLQDEIDACSPRALLCINQALANDVYTFPNGETVKRHTDFVYIAGANTVGNGATFEYVGRAQLDKASLDRFFQIEIIYDAAVEQFIANQTALINGMELTAPNAVKIEKILAKVRDTREKIKQRGIKHVLSPRTSARMVAMLAQGETLKELDDILYSGLSADQIKLLEQK